MNSQTDKTRRILVSLPESQLAALDRLAVQRYACRSRARSFLIRRALQMLFRDELGGSQQETAAVGGRSAR